MKTLVINGKPAVAGSTNSMERYMKKIIRRKKKTDMSIRVLEGIIFKLEEAI